MKREREGKAGGGEEGREGDGRKGGEGEMEGKAGGEGREGREGRGHPCVSLNFPMRCLVSFLLLVKQMPNVAQSPTFGLALVWYAYLMIAILFAYIECEVTGFLPLGLHKILKRVT